MTKKTNPAKDTIDILVVEDSPTQAEQLRYLLEQHSYGVTMANNGMQALECIDKHMPSLVISDIIMPKMDGYELCKRIKAEEKTRGIPVILLTSLTNSEDVLEGLACGADNFLTKPYNEEYLLSTITQILANMKFSKNERVRIGVEIQFAGKTRFITADQQQMLSLLISTYEAAVTRNKELIQTQNELRSLNDHLEYLVAERTASLSTEIAEHRRAEDGMRIALTKYKTLFDCFPMGVTVSDEHGKILESNPTAEKLLGIPREEQNQRDINGSEWRIVRPDGTPMPSDEFASVRALKEKSLVENVEMGILIPDKAITWISVTATPLPIEGYGVIITYNDITERKRAEREIAYLAKFPSENPNPVLRLSQDGIVMYANAASDALLGMWGCAVGGQAPRFWRDLIIQMLASGEEKTVDIECDGKVYSMSVTPFAEPGYINLYGRDVTERKRAEEALIHERNLLKALMDNSSDRIYFKDADSRITRISKAQADVFGLSDPSQAVGKTDSDFFTEEHALPAFKNEREIMRTGLSMVGLEEKETWLDGRETWVSTTKFPRTDINGNIIGTIGISRDITERRRAEEELQNKLKELQRWYAVTVDREERNLELKREVNELLKETGRPVKYGG